MLILHINYKKIKSNKYYSKVHYYSGFRYCVLLYSFKIFKEIVKKMHIKIVNFI